MAETMAHALEKIDACWKDRIDPPLVTLCVFSGRVASADHLRRAAVAWLDKGLVSQWGSVCHLKPEETSLILMSAARPDESDLQ